MPITASRNAVARNSGTRKIRIFALAVSTTASAAPPAISLTKSAGTANTSASGSPAAAIPTA